MIEANNLCKVFKKTIQEQDKTKAKRRNKTRAEEFFAVDHVSLKAYPGEVLGILGPNGAGKTTLLRMLGSLMTPTSGEIVIRQNDEEIRNREKQKQLIGYLSENTKLYHRFSVREMLMVFGEIYGLSKEENEERASKIIETLSMGEFADNQIGRLSTGQTQRANIARCLVHEPEIYIFDEPTLGLDVMSSETILNFMSKEREKGKTILYSTHYMEEAQFLCDKVAFLYHGKILHYDTPSNLMKASETTNLRDAFLTMARIADKGGNVDET